MRQVITERRGKIGDLELQWKLGFGFADASACAHAIKWNKINI